jgi:hypothetical protein
MLITDLGRMRDSEGRLKNPWRADLQPASFLGAYFYVDANAVDSGRRVVTHEFPKKDVPYTEDMGRRAYEFTVRGYCIQYPHDRVGTDGSQLRQRDYRIARNILADVLARGDPGPLFLPTMKGREITVICPRFRLSEEERAGGYCIFDMTFVELGVAPREPPQNPRDAVIDSAQNMNQRTIDVLTAGPEEVHV